MDFIKHRKIRINGLLILIFFCVVSLSPFAVDASDKQLKDSEKYISYMRSGLNKIAERIRKATEKTDIALLNCLKKKERIMKGYLDSALRNQENLRSAWKARDSKESDRFLLLTNAAHNKFKEIEASIKECYSKELIEEGTRVEVIRPEGTIEDELIDMLFPDEREPVEDMPAVAPASPFR